MRVKFGSARAVIGAFAEPMAGAFERSPASVVRGAAQSMVVTWVPLARRRRRIRGFDQAEALARQLARRIGVPTGGPAPPPDRTPGSGVADEQAVPR